MLTYKQWLLQEISLKGLADGTGSIRHSPSEYPQAKFVNITKIQGAVGVKTLTAFGEIPSFTRREAGYTQAIMFKNVNFSDKKEGDNWVQLPDNEDVWYEKPSLDKHDVACRCGCKDDQFMWQIPRKKYKALLGNLISYTKKTDREPKNLDVPGICKHLKNFTLALIQKGYIQE